MAMLDWLTKKLRYRKALLALDRINPGNKRLRILEIGSEYGYFNVLLNERGHHVTTLDILPGADFIHDLNNPLPFEDREFDMVIALAVVEHIENWELAINELARVGEVTYLTTPTPFGKIILDLLAFFNMVDREHIADHKHYLTHADLFKSGYYSNTFTFWMNREAINQ